MIEMIDLLQDEMRERGFSPPHIVLNNKFIRFGRNRGDDEHWLVGFETRSRTGKTIIFAYYGDWRTQQKYSFEPKDFTVYTPEERAEFRAQQRALEAIIEKERAEERDRARIKALQICTNWGSAKWKTGYFKRKGLTHAFGSFPGIDLDGEFLCVPLRNIAGELKSMQRIRNDGEKRFLKGGEKRGLMHVLRKGLEGSPIYIAEGFATAGTIADAMPEGTVVCAFDAGNMFFVARELRRANMESVIYIAGDNDESNVGQDAARAAAEGINAIVVICPEPGKDFNDIGIEATRLCFEPRAEETEGVGGEEEKTVEPGKGVQLKYLGFDSGEFYFASSYSRDVHKLNSFSDIELLKMLPLNYLQTMWPAGGNSKTAVDWLRCKSELVTASNNVGKFDPARIRSTGVWRDGDQIIVHLGNRVWSNKLGYMQLMDKRLENLYLLERDKSEIHSTPLRVDEMSPLTDLLEKLPAEKVYQGMLVGGWIVSAILGGLLSWRPHIWLTGEQGSGKTTVLNDMINHLIGPAKIAPLGNSTGPGLVRVSNYKSCPVIFDEFESMSKNDLHTIEACLTFIRQSSSNSQGQIIKASGSSGTISYSAKISACLASIKSHLPVEQDRARFTVVEMVKHSRPWAELRPFYAAIGSQEFAERFRARVYGGAEVFLKNVAIFREAIVGESRFRDQHAPLWAGWQLLRSDEVLSVAEAQDVLSFWEADVAPEVENESSQMLEYLLAAQIMVDENDRPSTSRTSIMECIQKVADRDTTKRWEHALMLNDMKVTTGDGGMHQYLHICSTAPAVRKFLNDKPQWANWCELLKRIPGARARKAIRYSGLMRIGVSIPISALLS